MVGGNTALEQGEADSATCSGVAMASIARGRDRSLIKGWGEIINLCSWKFAK